MPDPDPLAQLVRGNTAFALDLYAQLRDTPGSLCCSPCSLSAALVMTGAGARAATRAQMERALHVDLSQEAPRAAFRALLESLDAIQRPGRIQIKTANSLFPQRGYNFLPEYLQTLETVFKVSLQPLDYSDPQAARAVINAWVEARTAKKITNLIQPGILNALTRLTLVNAIYFKGDWAATFDKRLTRDAGFYTPGGEISLPMMNRAGRFAYRELEDAQALELPYEGGSLSRLVILPGERDGLPRLESRLAPAFLEPLSGSLPETTVSVTLPRFKASAAFRLNEALVRLGMGDAFDANRADFSGMDGSRALFIAAALHKAFLEVNEQGSEAAAASAVVMQLRSAPPQRPPVFRADHPFLFLIRERASGSILFLGRYCAPEKEPL